jgi:hypothetical protein
MKPWNRTIHVYTQLKRKTALAFKSKKKKPSKDEAAGLVYGKYHKWVGRKPCMIRGRNGHECFGPVVGHHRDHVGSGGQDYRNEVPLCWSAHTLSPFSIHMIGETAFNERYGVDVARTAHQLGDQWDAKQRAA